jgi:hypothetical protein
MCGNNSPLGNFYSGETPSTSLKMKEEKNDDTLDHITWHATRIVLEAQRRVAFSVLRLVFGAYTQTRHLSERSARNKKEASVTTSPPKIVPAHRATGVVRTRVRSRKRSSKRAGKTGSR